MFSARLINHNNTRLLNICDSNLLGKTIISEKLSIKISESYYGEKSIKKMEQKFNFSYLGKALKELRGTLWIFIPVVQCGIGFNRYQKVL